MIKDKLRREIEQYCQVNNIDNIEEEINNILQIGFNVIRFGVSPFKRIEDVELTNDNNVNKENSPEEVIKPKKKRGRRPKPVLSEIEEKHENVDAIIEEPQKVKVRIIKNK